MEAVRKGTFYRYPVVVAPADFLCCSCSTSPTLFMLCITPVNIYQNKREREKENILSDVVI